MKYVIACRALGADCDFVASSNSPAGVKRIVWGHVRQDHTGLDLTAGLRAELERHMDDLMLDQVGSDRPRWRRHRQ